MAVETRAEEAQRFETTMKEHKQMLAELRDQLKMQGKKWDKLCAEVADLTGQVQRPGVSLPSMGHSGEYSSVRERVSNGHGDSLGVLKRIGQIDFPKFASEDFNEWLYKLDPFFEFEVVLDELKIKITSVHLDGETLH